MKKNKVYFKGYYGFKNIGDDIFVVTANWICKNLWKNIIPIFIGDRLPKITKDAVAYKIQNRFFSKIIEFFICIRAEKIIYFGGSVFSKGISGLRDLKFYLNTFPNFNKKLGTIGTSIGPFNTKEDFYSIKDFLAKFQFIKVRDYSSISILEEMELKDSSNFIFDPAILVTEVYPSLKKENSSITKELSKPMKLAVSLCHYERYTGGDISLEKERENSVLNFIKNIIKVHPIEEIVFFEFNGNEINGDLEITKEFNDIISRNVKTSIVKYSGDTEDFLKELRKCDFVLGIRLHSAILAYALEIPFLLVEYHKKCTEFLNTINSNYRFQIGNTPKNVETFINIAKMGYLPNIKEPKYFKEIMLNELNEINQNWNR